MKKILLLTIVLCLLVGLICAAGCTSSKTPDTIYSQGDGVTTLDTVTQKCVGGYSVVWTVIDYNIREETSYIYGKKKILLINLAATWINDYGDADPKYLDFFKVYADGVALNKVYFSSIAENTFPNTQIMGGARASGTLMYELPLSYRELAVTYESFSVKEPYYWMLDTTSLPQVSETWTPEIEKITETPTPVPTIPDVRQGTSITVTSGQDTVLVTVLKVITGDEAVKLIKKANMFNSLPQSNEQMFLVKVYEKYLYGKSSSKYTSPYNFDLYVNGAGYAAKHAVMPESHEQFPSVDLLPGSSASGWLVFIVPKTSNAKLSYESYSGPLGFIRLDY